MMPFELTEEPENTCKGTVYRLKQQNYLDNKGNFVSKTTMVLQKRLSCTGCPKCGNDAFEISESVSCGKPPIINDIDPNALYTLTYTNFSTDWESGIVDGYDVEFVKLPKE